MVAKTKVLVQVSGIGKKQSIGWIQKIHVLDSLESQKNQSIPLIWIFSQKISLDNPIFWLKKMERL